MNSLLGRAMLAAFVLILASGCGSSRNGTAPLKVTGSVKYNLDGNITSATSTMNFVYLGEKLETVTGSRKEADGTTTKWKATVTYTEDLVTEISTRSGEITVRESFSYDEDDRLDTIRTTQTGGAKSTLRLEYDEDGRLERTNFDASDGSEAETIYRYDTDGLLESVETEDEVFDYTWTDDRLSRITAQNEAALDADYEYDGDDRLAEVVGQQLSYEVGYGDDGLVNETRARFDSSVGGFTSTVTFTDRIEYADYDVVGIVFYPDVPGGRFFDMEGTPFTELTGGLMLKPNTFGF